MRSAPGVAAEEILNPAIDELWFKDLESGDVLAITMGPGEEAWEYYFVIEDMASYPKGILVVRNPSGEETDEMPFELHGAGSWTARAQNPVQRQMGLAFTPCYGGIYVGGFLFGRQNNKSDRVIFGNKGQEISHIAYFRPTDTS